MTKFKNNLSTRRGFTLIELLIVIAILGVLAVVVLVAINPIQQLARTRDAGRKSGVTQLGHAIEANGTTNNGTYLTPVATWITSLVTAGELANAPQAIGYSAPASGSHPAGATCTPAGNNQNGYCYVTYGTNSRFIVYTRLESGADNGRCPTATQAAWFVYSSTNSSGGILCTAGQATPPGDPGTTGYSGTSWIQ